MKARHKTIGTGLAVGLGLLLPACEGQPDDSRRHRDEAPENLATISGQLQGVTSTFWQGAPPIISVCWENASNGTISGTGFVVSEATARRWVQESVERSWQRYARVNFVGWGDCASDSQVRLHIDTTNLSKAPVTLVLGNRLSGLSAGVRLSLYYNDTENTSRCKPDKTTYHSCLTSDAMHEFGHVLGFTHEEERSDYSGPDCGGEPFGKKSGTKYGAYDQRSIMSYCSDGVNGTKAFQTLSPNDIAAVQRAYGRRIQGQVVSARGYCLAANNFNPGNPPGPLSFLFTCDEFADDQEWSWTPISRRLGASISSAPGNPACITSADARVNDCDGSGNQTFRAYHTEIRGWGGLCLDLINGDQTNGNPIQSFDCLQNANQLWNISDAGEIKLAANTNKCITVNGGGTANGTQLVISTCTGASSQKFRFANDHIYFATGGINSKCFDMPAVTDANYVKGQDLPVNGEIIQIWDCLTPQRNQLWNLTGSFRNPFGQCLDRNSGDGDGTNMTTEACDDGDSQIWDYYFKETI